MVSLTEWYSRYKVDSRFLYNFVRIILDMFSSYVNSKQYLCEDLSGMRLQDCLLTSDLGTLTSERFQ